METGPAPPEVLAAPSESRFGKFVRTRKLGAGGMGEVWQAWDMDLSRWVALKFVKGGDDEELARFKREAQLAGALSHPNIAAVYEVGEAQGRAFIAMQYIDGTTLKTLKAGDHAVTARSVLDVARAVAYAHSQGVIHRDLKPDNVMLATESGARRVFVMDFGLARSLQGPSRLSVSGMLVGTPSYMSPEQARGETADRRSDVFSLGATLYELLTGRLPFEGETVVDTLLAVVQAEPTPPRRLDPRIPRDLETITLRCMEKDPARRYPGALELAEDLERFLSDRPILARPASAWYRLSKALRRHRAVALTASACVLVLAAVLAWPSVEAALDRRRREAARHTLEDRAQSAVRVAGERLSAGDAEDALARAEAAIREFGPRAAEGVVVPVARAHLVAARAAAKRGDVAAGLRHFAATYRAGHAGRPDEREAAAEALLEIGAHFGREGAFDRARGALEAILDRFPESPAAARARFELACTLESLGLHAQALAQFDALERGLGPDELARRDESRRVLRALLPATEHTLPSGSPAFGDLTGDGRPELVIARDDDRIAVWSVAEGDFRLVSESACEHGGRLLIADVDGDGANEVVTAWGSMEESRGEVRVWEWRAGTLQPGPPADLKSPAAFVQAADMNGDGRPELVVSTHYPVREVHVFHCRDGRLERLMRWNPGSEITGVLFGDYRAEPGLEGLFMHAWWDSWILFVGRWQPGAARLEIVDEIRRAGRTTPHQPFMVRLPDDRVAFVVALDKPVSKAVVDEGRAKPEDMLENGVYVVSPARKLETPQRHLAGPVASIHLAELGGRRWLLRSEWTAGGRVVLGPLPGEAGSEHLVAPSMMSLQSGLDLDGDGDTEIVAWTRGSGRLLMRVHGWGRDRPAPPPARRGTASRTIGSDLLEFGLAREAEEEFRARGDDLGVGRALMDQERWREAAEALAGERGRRTAALRLQARCRERMRDWPALAGVLEETLEQTDLDRLDRDEARRQLSWVREVVGMRERGRLATLAAGEDLLCEEPLLVRRTGDDLAILCRVGTSFTTGVPFWYGGGPIRFEWEMQYETSSNGTLSSAGLFGDRSLAMHLEFGQASGGELRSTKAWLAWGGSRGNSERTALPREFAVQLATWYRVSLEYMPATRDARLTVQGDGRSYERSLEVPHILERGQYRFGKLPALWKPPMGGGGAIYRIRDIRLVAYDPSTGFEAVRKPDARATLHAANGDFVCGRVDRALKRYGELVAVSAREPDVALRARFFRGVLRLRGGDAGGAREDFIEARAIDSAAYDEIVSLSMPGLRSAEREAARKR